MRTGKNEAPGVLPDGEITNLIAQGIITTEHDFADGQVQPASLDLRLSDNVYRIRASFLPGKGRSVESLLAEGNLQMHQMNIADGAVLETGCVYLARLLERVNLPSDISGRCNPKSSTGRIDVFTRVVTDNGEAFDDLPLGYDGPLYLEISPRTYSIMARRGDKLAQMRLRRGAHEALNEITFSVDMTSDSGQPIGWRARRHAGIVDLQRTGKHDVEDFWEPLHPHRGQLVLNPGDFYILASKERVIVPADQAAEMAPIAPELGEFRAHYAGFFDPGFGSNDGGSRAVLEVRTRDVPFILEDGQPVGKLIYEAMAAEPDALYGKTSNHYQGQGLRLSKHFAQD